MDDYSLAGDMTTGGNLDDLVRGTVGVHYLLATAVIVVLLIVLVMLYRKQNAAPVQSFMPGTLMRMQQVSLDGSEAMAGVPTADYASMNCAANVPATTDAWSWMYSQLNGASDVLNPAAMAQGASGSYATSQTAAYGNETFSGSKTDSQLSAISQGY